jgi:hypothetical protein
MYALTRALLVCYLFSDPEDEGACSSEMLVEFQLTTPRYNAEGETPHNHCCESLKCYRTYQSWYMVYGGDIYNTNANLDCYSLEY